MNHNFTFLISYIANRPHLEACLNSIRKFYPKANIIISQDDTDFPIDDMGENVIYHKMRDTGSWADCCIGLMNACKTDIGVFMEHDCLLLKPIDDLIERLDTYDLIGIEDKLDGIRNSPNFAAQNFFILNVKKFKEGGVERVRVNAEPLRKLNMQNIESAYGITQNSKNILFLPTKKSGYGKGTFYGDYIHHMWFGSYQIRTIEEDGVDREWLWLEEQRLLDDYYSNKLCV